MSKLVWDQTGERLYETGVRNGVLYPMGENGWGAGVAWNGISSVTESPSGADANAIYADDTKYLELRALEEFGGTIEAYTYPDEWAECDGSASLATGIVVGQQKRKPFCLCYRTAIGNDTEFDDHGYKLHIVYNATASPSERAYETINDSPEAISFSWEFSTTPVAVIDSTTGEPIEGFKNTSLVTIDSTKVAAEKMTLIENALYGTNGSGSSQGTDAHVLLPGEILALIS